MDKYAIIKLGGRQFKVAEGNTFKIEKQASLKPELLAYFDGKTVFLDKSDIADVAVKLSRVKDILDKKIIVQRFMSKSRYRKRNGHRQPISILKVDGITKKGESSTVAVKEAKVIKEAKPMVKKAKPAVKKSVVVKKKVVAKKA